MSSSWRAWSPAGFSASRRTCLAKTPCLVALRAETALPWGVRGPVDFCALRRLALRRASEIIRAQDSRANCKEWAKLLVLLRNVGVNGFPGGPKSGIRLQNSRFVVKLMVSV